MPIFRIMAWYEETHYAAHHYDVEAESLEAAYHHLDKLQTAVQSNGSIRPYLGITCVTDPDNPRSGVFKIHPNDVTNRDHGYRLLEVDGVMQERDLSDSAPTMAEKIGHSLEPIDFEQKQQHVAKILAEHQPKQPKLWSRRLPPTPGERTDPPDIALLTVDRMLQLVLSDQHQADRITVRICKIDTGERPYTGYILSQPTCSPIHGYHRFDHINFSTDHVWRIIPA